MLFLYHEPTNPYLCSILIVKHSLKVIGTATREQRLQIRARLLQFLGASPPISFAPTSPIVNVE